MTLREQIEALPWYKRAAFDAQVDRWARSQQLTNFLKGNADAVPQMLVELDEQDWTMYEPVVAQDETEQPEAPQTPAEETAPVEDDTAGGGLEQTAMRMGFTEEQAGLFRLTGSRIEGDDQ